MFVETLLQTTHDHSDDVAVVVEGRPITFAALDADVVAMAARLATEGIGPGDTVGITIKDDYRHLVVALALMRLGCIQVALASYEPMQYREVIAQRTKASVVIAETADDAPASLPVIVPDFSAGPAEASAATALKTPPPADAVWAYLTSSGTTGRAKIAPLTYRQLYQQARGYQVPADAGVLYRTTPFEYNNCKRNRLFTMAAGGVNVFADPNRTDAFEVCERYAVTRFNVSPLQAGTLLSVATEQQCHLPDTTLLRLGGSATGQELRQAIMRDLTPNLYVTYATTEIGGIATAQPQHHGADPAIVGRPHPGVELEIVDDDDRPLPAGERGFIRIRSPGMATGYFDDPEATAKAFRDGWFYPGDVGRLSAEGLLSFDGRGDEMINFASINIFPAEVESAIEKLPGVVECAMFVMKSQNFGDVPLLAAVAEESLTAEAILKYAKQTLGVRAPRKVFLVDSLPRSANGKISRGQLQQLIEPAPAETREH